MSLNEEKYGPPQESKVALKYDGEKPKHGLVSTKFLDGLARVLTFGAKKYAAHNWRKGFDSSRLYDSIQRHLTAWNDGEDIDPESGLPHLSHAACGLMFLTEQMITRPDLDDRYRAPVQKRRDEGCSLCRSKRDMDLEEFEPKPTPMPTEGKLVRRPGV